MTAWTVHQDAHGWSVYQGNRRVEDGLGTEEDAVDLVRRRYSPRDTVILQERDGYRTPITRRMKRRR